MPKFSVVIPTYNRADSLLRTLQSVLAQSFIDFEAIVVDDGSTDNTQQVVNTLKDPRIRYHKMINSGGPATPRNKGISEAKGEWICLLDSDDLWYPQKLMVLHDYLQKNVNIDVAYHSLNINMDYLRVTRAIYTRGLMTNSYEDLLRNGNDCPTSSVAVRKSFINRNNIEFDESKEFRIVEDYDFWLKLADCGARFVRIDQVLGEYVVGFENISGDVKKHRKNLLHILHYHVFEVQRFEPDKKKLWREIKAKNHAQFAVLDMKNKHYAFAIKNSSIAAFCSPKYFMRRFMKASHKILSSNSQKI
ncbi:glycosyltransferase family 2 protein [Halomonas sp. M20]|uniref:glycosyltransferase family 2 protein n=1 Tax=Halomonas sp. M20 TaxID=2763264 RepID=UPI001D0A9401|nr:glycosyltransferase [Halomonas sp. M20]